ncbi:hypothetical protein OHA70_36990 [Kribbella sp. NBC_00382]|uniref:hypothetical protein n=1 Tax=Kribbella sp. NBC_00382 TaxID=2975967 RepID=UPI002E21F88C
MLRCGGRFGSGGYAERWRDVHEPIEQYAGQRDTEHAQRDAEHPQRIKHTQYFKHTR